MIDLLFSLSQTSESDTVPNVNDSSVCNSVAITHQLSLHFDISAQCFCFVQS